MDCSNGKLYKDQDSAIMAGVKAEHLKMIDNASLSNRAMRRRRVRGNNLCPCGSGKRFKNCCRVDP
jgi:uncharacterized protein YchJ